ncbi:MAG: endonuclease [Aeromicrobium sp.]|nr:endonuclease [Aeromicrobium sp.]
MFEASPTGRLIDEVRAHDFAADPVHECGAGRIDAIKALDRAIRAAQAEQARQIAALHAERQKIMPLGTGDPSLSVIGEVAMARNISPGAAGSQLALALGMAQMPRVAALFADGSISEPVARAVVRESASLPPDDLTILDGELVDVLPGLTVRRAQDATRREVIRIDAEAARMRAEANRADCRISVFPEPDGVATMLVRGPAEQILAAHQALDSWAQGLRSTGDPRSCGQIMVHTLVERVTGLTHADCVDVEIELVLDAKTLAGDGDEPVDLTGYGPISPDVAEDIIARAPHASIRRLLVDPVDGALLVRDPRRRRFDSPTRAYVRARDRRCRQPGCDSVIRDDDHIHDFQHGGMSTADNAQGLCARSHTIKHQPGWTVTSQGKATIWTTPTGHHYRSEPPPLIPRARSRRLRQ